MGCSAQSLIITNPPNANVTLNDSPITNNTLDYGRWVGNDYDVLVTSPGFISKNLKLSPHLGDRSVRVSVVCFATIIGIPFLPIVFWNGELDDPIYVTLEPNNTESKK